MIRREPVVDCCDDSTARCKGGNETLAMSVPNTPASSMEDYNDRVLRFFGGLLVIG